VEIIRSLKRASRTVLPRWAFQSLRYVRWHHTVRLAKLTQYKVLSGPFAGMLYSKRCLVPYASSGCVLQKLLGAYEHQCSPFIDKAIGRSYSQIINIGAGEGLYAVGLALRLPSVPVIAFETDPYNQDLCAEQARLNGVASRIRIMGMCTPELLRSELSDRPLIVCDCEGGELELLNPAVVPGLYAADMLVELHDHINPIISKTMLSRFSETHSAESVTDSEIRIEDYPLLRGLAPEDQQRFVHEIRIPGMQWLFLSSHHCLKENGVN
jgi:hypothetical protein